ncbi:aquaporin-like protein [Geopyxis carbonaria]|nr:aquaporin-like protein [Geopyxis carbonaria]
MATSTGNKRASSILPLFNAKRRSEASGVGSSTPEGTRNPNSLKNHLVAAVGEFVGTFMFLFFAFTGTQVANNRSPNPTGEIAPPDTGSNTSQLLYIALCFGFSLTVNVWVFFRISGGLFNPAVTLGLFLIGGLPGIRAVIIFVTQLLAGMASAGVVSALFPGKLNVSTSLSNDTSVAQGVFIEAFLTFELVFTIFMLAAEKHKATFLAPIGIGLALFIAELAGVYYTGGSLNPTRSFGPAVATRYFPSEHWIYWVGPALGTLAAVSLYRFIKVMHYEEANPGQDRDLNETVVTVRGDGLFL